MLQSRAYAAPIFAMDWICGAVPVDAVFAGYDGRGRGDGPGKTFFCHFMYSCGIPNFV